MDEQRKIAGVLGVVQRAIEQQERMLALTAELKKALLHKLFTEGLRGEPQKQTEIGPVPKSWTATTLGELACKPDGFLQTGPFGSQLHKHDYLTEGVGVVNPTHLWGNRINHEDVPRVSPETAARLDRHLLKAGDILFARRGEIGRHGMVTKDEEGWLCGTGCFLARVRQEYIDNRFLSYLFSTRGVIAWLNSHAAGAIMPNLNNTVLRSMPVFFPSKDVQTVIADCLDATEQKMAIHQRKHAALTDFFRTLLHQLMTAQLRVYDLDLPGMGHLNYYGNKFLPHKLLVRSLPHSAAPLLRKGWLPYAKNTTRTHPSFATVTSFTFLRAEDSRSNWGNLQMSESTNHRGSCFHSSGTWFSGRFGDSFPDRVPESFSPLRFFSTKPEHDAVRKFLPDELKEQISYPRMVEVQARQITEQGKPSFGLLIGSRHRWQFKVNLRSLLNRDLILLEKAFWKRCRHRGRRGIGSRRDLAR